MNLHLSPVPMRTMLVGLLPAKSISAAVAHVGLVKPVLGARVNEVWANPIGHILNIIES